MRRALGLLAVLTAGISLAAPGALASQSGPAGPVGPAGHRPSATREPASFGIRLVDVPPAERADPRAWAYIINDIRPGTVIHRRV